MPTDIVHSKDFFSVRKKGRHLSVPLTRTYLGLYFAVKALYFFYVPWGCHLHYGPDLVCVGLDSPMKHHESQELSCCYYEGTLSGIELHVVGT